MKQRFMAAVIGVGLGIALILFAVLGVWVLDVIAKAHGVNAAFCALVGLMLFVFAAIGWFLGGKEPT